MRFRLIVALFALAAGIGVARAEDRTPPKMYGLEHRFNLNELPPGRLSDQLRDLPEPARHRAMEWMHRFSFPAEDVRSLHVDREGGVLYVCEFPPAESDVEPGLLSDPEIAQGPVPISPFPDSLKFHSRPGAPNVIYLDFTGTNITGTGWNAELNRDPIPALPFSTDTDYTTFSDAEQAAIKRIWQRVAEDYAPFHVNVTTEMPATWNNRTAHVVITRNTDTNGQPMFASGAGGVAYVNVFNSFNFGYYRPAWVYHNNLSNREDYIAEAATHEAGHNLGLSHDGKTGGTEYYSGHGSGATSWGPIMGVAYNRNVSQWSKGEYYLANNTQDDLAIMAGKMGYRADDHGDTFATASFLTITSNTLVLATNPENDPHNTQTANKGVISRTNDVDLWAFSSGSGLLNLTVRPWVSPANTRGGNIDIRATLYNDGGNPLIVNDPSSETFAQVQAVVTSGVYYLKIEGVGTGDPFSSSPTGYTEYGSIGQYFVTGTVADISGVIIPPQAALSASNVTAAGTTSHTFQIVYTDNVAIQVSSLGDDDARVTGPNGYDQAAQLMAVDVMTDGTPRTGTYRIAAPGGSWDASDNGVYTVSIHSNAVRDVEGAYVPAGSIGAFTSAVPDVIYGAYMDVNPGWTLEPLWAYGQPGGSGGMPSSGFTGPNVIAYNLNGNYERNLSLKYATTPLVDCSNTDVVLLRFRRWLGVRAGDTAIIQVSTNGAVWSTVWSSSGAITEGTWSLIQHDISAFAARSPTVQVRWGMGSNNDAQVSYGWNLDDVEILGVIIPLDTAPPSASLFAMDVTEPGATLYEFSVTYTDDSGVDIATLGDDNLIVIGPVANTLEATLLGVDDDSNGSPRTGFYRITPPGGAWDAEANGTYTIALLDGVVKDVEGNAMSGQTLGTFEVDIPVFGAVSFSLDPAKAREQGAQWRLLSGAETNWLNSGAQAGGLVPGEYTVSFRTLDVWIAPDDQAIVVAGDETNHLNAAYEAIVTTNYSTPLWWLIENGYTEDFEQAVEEIGANGMRVWESYVAGLNPNDPESVFRFRVTPTSIGEDGLHLMWTAISGRTYSLFSIPELGQPEEPIPDAQDMPWPQDSYLYLFENDSRGALRLQVKYPQQ